MNDETKEYLKALKKKTQNVIKRANKNYNDDIKKTLQETRNTKAELTKKIVSLFYEMFDKSQVQISKDFDANLYNNFKIIERPNLEIDKRIVPMYINARGFAVSVKFRKIMEQIDDDMLERLYKILSPEYEIPKNKPYAIMADLETLHYYFTCSIKLKINMELKVDVLWGQLIFYAASHIDNLSDKFLDAHRTSKSSKTHKNKSLGTKNNIHKIYNRLKSKNPDLMMDLNLSQKARKIIEKWNMKDPPAERTIRNYVKKIEQEELNGKK